MSLAEEIVELLESNPRIQHNAKSIDRSLQPKEDYYPDKNRIAKIRTELNRLHKKKVIKKPARGFYQAIIKPKTLSVLENPPVTLHGIKLQMEILENNINGIQGIPSHSNKFEAWLISNDFEATTNYRYTVAKWFEQRKVTVTVHRSGLVEIFIRASSNPLVLNDFLRLLDWLNGFFEPVTPFKRRNVSLVQVGVARDFEQLRMEDVGCISLRKFVNDWCQIYYKEEIGKTRFEHHLTFKDPVLTLEEAVNSLMLLTYAPLNNGNGDSGFDFIERGGYL